MNEKSYNIFLICLLILSEKVNWQISYAIIIGLVLYFVIKYGLIKKHLKLIWELIFIILIGSIVGVIYLLLNTYNIRDYMRDIILVISPIIYILFGLYLSRNKILDKMCIYKAYVYSGIIISIIHIYSILTNFNLIREGINNRGVSGRGSSITIIAIIILLFIDNNGKKMIIKNSIIRSGIIFFLIMSFIFYFSRTDFALLIGFLVIFLFVRKSINPKEIIKKIVGICIIIAVVLSIVPKKTMNEFIYKLSRSSNEISYNSDDWTWEKINNDWRGYEVYRSKYEFTKGNVTNKFCGFGFGKNVDLGIQIKLGDTMFSRIPILHNGYYYILLKTGILGLALYLIFLVKLFIKNLKNIINERNIFESKLICGSIIGLFISTYVVAGLYNKEGTIAYCLLLGYFNGKNISCKE